MGKVILVLDSALPHNSLFLLSVSVNKIGRNGKLPCTALFASSSKHHCSNKDGLISPSPSTVLRALTTLDGQRCNAKIVCLKANVLYT